MHPVHQIMFPKERNDRGNSIFSTMFDADERYEVTSGRRADKNKPVRIYLVFPRVSLDVPYGSLHVVGGCGKWILR